MTAKNLLKNEKLRISLGINHRTYIVLCELVAIIIDGKDALEALELTRQDFREKDVPLIKKFIEDNIESINDNVDNLQYYKIPLTNAEINKLKSLGIVEELTQGNITSNEKLKYRLNKNELLKIFILDKNIAFEDILNVFTGVNILINGVNFPVRNISKPHTFASISEKYYNDIDGKLELHNEVKRACQFAVNNNLITSGITSIIEGKVYKDWMLLINNNTQKVEQERHTF